MPAKLSKLFTEFFDSEKASGIILLLCACISLIITNSSFGIEYLHFWHHPLFLKVSSLHLDLTVEEWINDGLMAVFFLLVGLEIERELYVGELSSPKKAILPVLAAIGGMIVPALIHFAFNHGQPSQAGFGIPMATDIAFALGVLALLGDKVPSSLKIFLTALAIIDDLGAILVIAVFYNHTFSLLYFSAAIGIFLLMLVMNRLKIQRLFFYIVPGIVMWYCMHQSGIHSTISGVLLAFAIPFNRKEIENSPSHRLQHFLHKPVAFFIMPAFALANSCLLLEPGWHTQLFHDNSIGIFLGLFLGKPVGVFLFSILALKAGWSVLPDEMNKKHLLGAGILGGIGFTMSIFISNLAFRDTELILLSKATILITSVVAGIAGLLFLKSTGTKNR